MANENRFDTMFKTASLFLLYSALYSTDVCEKRHMNQRLEYCIQDDFAVK
jgi:hypothetical protein